MPDLLTHYAIAHLSARRWWRPATSIFLLGTILPDLLTRPFYIFWPEMFWLVMPLHTPAGILVVSGMIAAAFHAEHHATIFWSLSGGAALHFVLDALQKHLVAGYFWLWPFSWWTTERGFFWPEASLAAAPWLAMIVLLWEGFCALRRR